MEHIPGAPPFENTPHQDTIDPKKSDDIFLPDTMTTNYYRKVVEVEYVWGNYMAKELDYTINIACSPNYGILGIHFGLQMTFKKLSYLAHIQRCNWIKMFSVDCITSILYIANPVIPSKCLFPNSIIGSVTTVKLMITQIAFSHYIKSILAIFKVPIGTDHIVFTLDFCI